LPAPDNFLLAGRATELVPIYEYRCKRCAREFSFLSGVTRDTAAARCPACESRRLQKLVSRVHAPRSEEAELESFESMDVPDTDDPREMVKWMKKLSKRMGEKELGEELEAELEEAAASGELDEELARGKREGWGDRDEMF